jgi:hypothetical protein
MQSFPSTFSNNFLILNILFGSGSMMTFLIVINLNLQRMSASIQLCRCTVDTKKYPLPDSAPSKIHRKSCLFLNILANKSAVISGLDD